MSNPVSMSPADIIWHIAPEHREQLLGAAGLRLDDWLRLGQARVVKHGPHRTVYHVSLPELSFYLKHYRLHDSRAWLRQLVRPAKARMEHDRALAVAQREVPTIAPLGHGERRSALGAGDSFLLTYSLENAEPLGAFVESVLPGLPPERQVRLRQRLARELGRLLARMHDAGVVHHDLHAGNLLVRLGDDARPELFLIDLHAVRLGGPLDWPASRENLIVLNRWAILRVGRTDRLRFWLAYRQERKRPLIPARQRRIQTAPSPPASGGEGWGEGGQNSLTQHESMRDDLTPSPPAPLPRSGGEGRYSSRPAKILTDITPERDADRDQIRALERGTWASNLDFWSNRDRRCLAANRYYERVRSEQAAGHALRELDPSFLAKLLEAPDAPFAEPGVVLLKDSRSSTVAELEAPVNGELRRVIYKRFRVTSWSAPWLALLRRPAALRSWVFGHGLRERGLPTPRPLAVFFRRAHGLIREGYLLTEKVPDAVELNRHVAELGRLPRPERQRRLREDIDRIARLVRELHRRHLSHRDLKAANILISPARCPWSVVSCPLTQTQTDRHAWLIDLVGVCRHRNLRRSKKIQNLARLHASFLHSPAVTRTDKLRFLRIYLQWGLFGATGWKRWWRAIGKATQKKVARNLRTGRLLA